MKTPEFKSKILRDNYKSLSRSYTNKLLKFIDDNFSERFIEEIFQPASAYIDYAHFHSLFVEERGTLEYCCGVCEIETSGQNANSIKKVMLDAALHSHAFGVATMNEAQADKLPMWKELGWKVAQNWKVNPNSGNKIILLTCDFTKVVGTVKRKA